MNIISIIKDVDPFTVAAIIILIVMSVYSWGMFFFKYFYFRKYKAIVDDFSRKYEAKKKISELAELAEKNKDYPPQNLFLSHFREFRRLKLKQTNLDLKLLSDYLSRNGQIIMDEHSSDLEFGMNSLASIGATAPFVGLLGTVTGVVATLYQIGFDTKSIQFAAAAPGLSSALVATAVGLLVAVPAVLFYNYYRNQIRLIDQNLQSFNSKLINWFILTTK